MGLIDWFKARFGRPAEGADNREHMNARFFMSVLKACPAGSKLLVIHDREECFINLRELGEASQIGYNRFDINPGLIERAGHFLRHPEDLRRAHALSIEGPDGRLLFQVGEGFAVDYLIEDLWGSFLDCGGRKIIGILGTLRVDRPDRECCYWTVRKQAYKGEKEAARLRTYLDAVFREFPDLFIWYQPTAGHDPLAGCVKGVAENTWQLARLPDVSKIFEALHHAMWLAYAAPAPVPDAVFNGCYLHKPGEVEALLKKHNIRFLLDARSRSTEWHVAVNV